MLIRAMRICWLGWHINFAAGHLNLHRGKYCPVSPGQMKLF